MVDVDPHLIKGVGFDATCSLVAIDKSGEPLSVSPTGKLFSYCQFIVTNFDESPIYSKALQNKI